MTYQIQYRTVPDGEWYDDPYFGSRQSLAAVRESIAWARRSVRPGRTIEYRLISRETVETVIEDEVIA